MPMHARAQRLARGWLVGLVATSIATVSHSLAGGYRPGILSFGVALIFAGMLGTAVIGTKPSLPRLAVAVGGAQSAFHLLFSLLGAGGGAAAADPTGGMGMAAMNPSPIAAPVMSAHDHFADPGMWVAHAVAAVLTILFLRHAELAVWGMLARLGRVLATRLTVVPAPIPAGARSRIPAWPAIVLPPIERMLVASASRRGPPLLTF
jgi:hypothetical protein